MSDILSAKPLNHWIQAFFRHGVGNWKSKGTSSTCFLPTFLPFALGSTFEYTGYNVPALPLFKLREGAVAVATAAAGYMQLPLQSLLLLLCGLQLPRAEPLP